MDLWAVSFRSVQGPRFLSLAVAATAMASSGLFAQETNGPFGLSRGMNHEHVIQIVGKDTRHSLWV